MNPKGVLCAALFAAGVCGSAAIPAWADDSAASIAAGGLVPRREVRIVMAKEVLRISPDKVVVDYDFRNDTDQDVTTEVAFPVPPYSFEILGPDIAKQSFSDFQLLVNGAPIRYSTEVKATLNGQDVTDTLNKYKIDIRNLADPDWNSTDENGGVSFVDFERLSKSDQKQLEAWGLFDRELETFIEPRWEVHLQYHWRQSFPAHSTVHIRHEYSPVVGSQFMTSSPEVIQLANRQPYIRGSAKLDTSDRAALNLLTSFCPDAPLLQELGSKIWVESDGRRDVTVAPYWVDFTLTSANTWQRPIKDFTLIVERGKPLDGYGKPMKNRHMLVSFCSPQNAPVEKLDADHFQLHLSNFVPTTELHIGFFDLPDAAPAPGSTGKAR
jgi:hypothetical protein